MAKIGLKKPKYAKVTVTIESDGTETESYGTLTVLAKAVTANISVNTPDAKLYADDAVAESVTEFTSGTLSISTDDIENTVQADIYGATLSAGGDLTFKTNDTAPYLRLGFIVRRIKNGASQYAGYVYTRVKFNPVSDDFETKGETVAFKTSAMTAQIMRAADGSWKLQSAWKDTEADALTWLDANVKPTEQAEETEQTGSP